MQLWVEAVAIKQHQNLLEMTKIMKCLTDRFGASIWKKCVLVLTSVIQKGNTNENYKAEDKDEAYKMHVRNCVNVFKEALRECTSDVIPVKLILDCQVANELNND